jgi:DNA polymerase I-like protein with 3'-5' exonuclease and polymerase domains
VYDVFGDSIMDFRLRKNLSHEYGSEQVQRWYGDYKNALNNCLNFQIQSFAASVVNRAALAINRAFKERGWDAQVIAQIHDQLVMEVAEEHIEEAAKIVQHIMQTTTQPPGIILKAPPEIAINLRDGH